MKVVGQTVQPWERTQTDRRTDRQTDATKCIISLASRSIIISKTILPEQNSNSPGFHNSIIKLKVAWGLERRKGKWKLQKYHTLLNIIVSLFSNAWHTLWQMTVSFSSVLFGSFPVIPQAINNPSVILDIHVCHVLPWGTWKAKTSTETLSNFAFHTMYRGIRPFKFIHGETDNSGSHKWHILNWMYLLCLPTG